MSFNSVIPFPVALSSLFLSWWPTAVLAMPGLGSRSSNFYNYCCICPISGNKFIYTLSTTSGHTMHTIHTNPGPRLLYHPGKQQLAKVTCALCILLALVSYWCYHPWLPGAAHPTLQPGNPITLSDDISTTPDHGDTSSDFPVFHLSPTSHIFFLTTSPCYPILSAQGCPGTSPAVRTSVLPHSIQLQNAASLSAGCWAWTDHPTLLPSLLSFLLQPSLIMWFF